MLGIAELACTTPTEDNVESTVRLATKQHS